MPPGAASTGPGTAMAIDQTSPLPHLSCSSAPVEQGRKPLFDLGRFEVVLGDLVMLEEKAAGQVRDAYAQGRLTEYGNQNQPGLPPESDQPRRPAAGGRAKPALLDETEIKKCRQTFRDGGAAKPGVLLDVVPRARFPGAKQLDDRRETVPRRDSPTGLSLGFHPARR